MNDEEIKILIRTSREKGYCELVKKYKNYVNVIVSSVLKGYGTEEDTEECICDVFVKLVMDSSWARDSRTALKAFIGVTARNTAIDTYRKLSGRSRYITDDELDENISSGNTPETYFIVKFDSGLNPSFVIPNSELKKVYGEHGTLDLSNISNGRTGLYGYKNHIGIIDESKPEISEIYDIPECNYQLYIDSNDTCDMVLYSDSEMQFWNTGEAGYSLYSPEGKKLYDFQLPEEFQGEILRIKSTDSGEKIFLTENETGRIWCYEPEKNTLSEMSTLNEMITNPEENQFFNVKANGGKYDFCISENADDYQRFYGYNADTGEITFLFENTEGLDITDFTVAEDDTIYCLSEQTDTIYSISTP